MKIAEHVTYKHPDKMCDVISDAVLDACLAQDPTSRVAVETLGGHDTVVLIGEVTTKADVDFAEVARMAYYDLMGEGIGVLSNIVKQSPDIKAKVDSGGAGDQGIMVGYACDENENYIPQETYLARKLLEGVDADGKSQVVMDGSKIKNIVLSVQGRSQKDLEERVKDVLFGYDVEKIDLYCNNIGAFNIGGFDGDTGCTGRKIVVDSYGPRVPVGGGAFSGKDPSKVDRSAAYMARFIALNMLKQYQAKEVLVRLGYVIGKSEPLLQEAMVDGRLRKIEFDCRPEAIIERLDLLNPIYKDTALYGHFGTMVNKWETLA